AERRGRDLLLAGRQPHSALYAVYHLLERHLGCGFIEDGDQVPARATVEVGPLQDRCRPRFEWRLYHTTMDYAYSGMRWWDWDQLKAWVDWMARKRLNLWYPCRLTSYTGIAALAAGRLGVPVALTEYQRQRQALMRRVCDYARTLGIRTVHDVTEIFSQSNQTTPGTYSFPDRLQLEEFARAYEARTGTPVPLLTYEWCGTPLPVLDPRSPVVQRFVSAAVEAYAEAVGTDHLYLLTLPSEGGWQSDDLEEMNRVTYAMLLDLVQAVRAGDPRAEIFTQPPFPYHRTFEAQKRAVQDAGLPILTIDWLNLPGRLQSFQMLDYYWGLPWTTGMTLTCGKHTNPYGDLEVAVRHARALAVDPRAAGCRGFCVASEINHRILVLGELFAELAWNPLDVEPGDFLRRWAARRYGPEGVAGLLPAVRAVAGSLLSHYNMDATNHPLYRDFRGGYLVGLTPGSVRRTLGYLPAMRQALEAMVAAAPPACDSPLLRFDLVDLGRTYLGALFNHALGRARRALRDRDPAAFEAAAARTDEVLRFTARYCSADPQFRLATLDGWARRWPEVLPGFANEESNWITFTALISPVHWRQLLDYMAEDLAELIEHYYRPRVRQYLDRMRQLLAAGQDLSGRLVQRGTDADLPFRVGDFAPPRGQLPWSPYGATCEPELTADDDELAHRIIQAGSVSGRYPFYEGPILPLARELLDRFPVPGDLDRILAEPEVTAALDAATLDGIRPGDCVQGLRVPGEVEDVVVPPGLDYLVAVEEVGREYNLRRGEVRRWRVRVSDFVTLTRRPDTATAAGGPAGAAFTFEVQGRAYRLVYDPGSETAVAAVRVALA
ncbi:MAG: alpha-N-acetylglucosaminidase C-terminal domain-containing protein, partial [Gemmatimonadota bacterium]